MPTRNVVLTNQQADFIDSMVTQGAYQNASELVREALRRLQREEEAWQQAKARVLEGLAQVERGEFAAGTPEEVFKRAFDEGRRRAKARGFE